MKIQLTYVSFEQAKLLEEKGFNEMCNLLYHYNGSNAVYMLNKNDENFGFSAPEQWQIVEWFRVNHGIWVDITLSSDSKFLNLIRDIKNSNTHLGIARVNNSSFFNTPQEAYSAAFDYILNNLL